MPLTTLIRSCEGGADEPQVAMVASGRHPGHYFLGRESGEVSQSFEILDVFETNVSSVAEQGGRAGEDRGGVRGGHGEGERDGRREGGRRQRVHQAQGQSVHQSLKILQNHSLNKFPGATVHSHFPGLEGRNIWPAGKTKLE